MTRKVISFTFNSTRRNLPLPVSNHDTRQKKSQREIERARRKKRGKKRKEIAPDNKPKFPLVGLSVRVKLNSKI